MHDKTSVREILGKQNSFNLLKFSEMYCYQNDTNKIYILLLPSPIKTFVPLEKGSDIGVYSFNS